MPWREPPRQSASPRAATHAKVLRRSMTEAERRLWQHLRHRLPVVGSHFRRQVALGSYVADFCCLSVRLIVEVDGEQHGLDRTRAYDESRTNALEQQGFRVLRFSNADVMTRIDGVLGSILAALATSPSIPASPADSILHQTFPREGNSARGATHGRHL